MFNDILENNKYLHTKEKKGKDNDKHSLCYLYKQRGVYLKQGNCIRMGIALENVLYDIVSKYSNFISIKPKNVKNEKETDALWKCDETKTIIYVEFKASLNLDTEKCKATDEKVVALKNKIELENPDYTVKHYLVGLRYRFRNEMPEGIISKKYPKLYKSNNIIGTNEYLELFGIPIFEDEEKYIDFISQVALLLSKTSE